MKLAFSLFAVLLVIAGCGGSNSNDNNTSTPSTVSMQAGVLVDSHGAPLYTSNQEKSGKVVCTGGCASIWIPLEAPGSGQPTGDGVSGKLGTVKRPDGTRQVTLDGRPLYRFAEDGNDGKATGNGVSDSFAGQQFTWKVEGGSSSTAGGGGGGGGGGNSYSY
jgi:predicted lipoprotein with Yx(FWY)xxD motif